MTNPTPSRAQSLIQTEMDRLAQLDTDTIIHELVIEKGYDNVIYDDRLCTTCVFARYLSDLTNEPIEVGYKLIHPQGIDQFDPGYWQVYQPPSVRGARTHLDAYSRNIRTNQRTDHEEPDNA